MNRLNLWLANYKYKIQFNSLLLEAKVDGSSNLLTQNTFIANYGQSTDNYGWVLGCTMYILLSIYINERIYFTEVVYAISCILFDSTCEVC